MRLTLTAKIKLDVSEEQKKLLYETGKRFNLACQYVSDYIFENRTTNKRKIHDAIYYDLRSKFKLHAQMAESVIRHVSGNYKTILENQKEWIKPKYKHATFDVVRNRSYSFAKGKNGEELLSISTLDGRIKTPFVTKGLEKYFDGTWKFGDSHVITKHGKWYLCLSCSKEIDELDDFDVKNVVGIDFGINFLAVSYDSSGNTKFYSGKEVKQRREHYKALRSELQERHTKSSLRRLKRIGQRENRWMADVNHCVSKALVENSPKDTLFVIEDLEGVRKSTEKVKKKDRYVQVSWAFFDLRKKLEYKAALFNDKVLAVDPAYTSQACPKCSHTEASNRNKKKHTFKCKNCGYTSNDDCIGAMNLFLKGIKYLQTVTPKQGFGVKGAVNHPTMQPQGYLGSELNEGVSFNGNNFTSGELQARLFISE